MKDDENSSAHFSFHLVKNKIQIMRSGHDKSRLIVGISPNEKAETIVKTGATENPFFNQKS